ncbi:hypothetical protein M441DRAFT_191116 [Trichoderma asperellum CBS 433.97]|uniref:Clr5 domain-containing protein n=1 Tax=Trichoderma asperellum (strain ATCC 204424 / CBS 433.97 / NBRC 101777) TaxID=1042311 RepID=A0A2T3ZCA2_TRIA4|nr:hypothetical protein M441DRAFT_191116 [Trichoderma asperellum CBS 433.97]PTB42422.1 hypothetical protein M441DRAFT_191116 [Trichoderma asperellum CBS 433.97]
MHRDYGFNATIKMYKIRLNKWGYFKNGRKGDAKLVSHTKRRKQVVSNLVGRAFGDTQPIAFICGTTRQTLSPKPVALRDPDVYGVPSHIFSSISAYMWGSYESQRWTVSEFACATFYENAYFRPSAELINSIVSLTNLLQEQKYHQAGPVMRRAAIQMENVLRDQPLDLLTCLLEIALRLHSTAPKLAVLLMRHSADIAKIYFSSPKHPVRVFTQQLASLDSAELGALAVEAYACQLKIWQNVRDSNPRNVGDSQAAGFVWITGLALAGDFDELPSSLVPRLDDLMLRVVEAMKDSEWCTELLQSLAESDQIQLFIGQSEGNLLGVSLQSPGKPTKVTCAQPVARYSLAHLNARYRPFTVEDRSGRETMEIQGLLQTEMGSFFMGMASALEGWLKDVGEYNKAAAVAQYREKFLAAGLADVISVI